MKSIFTLLAFLLSLPVHSQHWKPVPGKIASVWADSVEVDQVWNVYPRPQMKRKQWTSLNGMWDYALTDKSASVPTQYEGQILVPFAIESSLSGVGKRVSKDQNLWYKKQFHIPAEGKGKRLLLHFGAVDWEATVFINGQEVGVHRGGYDAFTFDITDYLRKSGKQELVVRVYDGTDDGYQPRGKQVQNPHGIWYTPVTGIWQTVWLEVVPLSYIQYVRAESDIDQSRVEVAATFEGLQAGDQLVWTAFDQGQVVAQQIAEGTDGTWLHIPNAKWWSPSNPYLYDLKLELKRKGKVIDQVDTYFAMRKISKGLDGNGVSRMLLNNEFVFQLGPLDQGWWPDGLYTAPSDAALKYDIEVTKALGFNMIRKHVKVEPARWYYYCDVLGMLVWQDMPSGDMGNNWQMHPGIIGYATDKDRSAESIANFKEEWKRIVKQLAVFPSIIVWVPFNEGWGQFDTEGIIAYTRSLDPTRLINGASGGNYSWEGDIMDYHHYPDPRMPDPKIYGQQILTIGEYGGLGLPIENHTWQQKDNWGYQSFKNAEELFDRYQAFLKTLQMLIPLGLSAAIYTQTTDVEVETNGILTYDRKVIKYPISAFFKAHQPLYQIPISIK
jgi:beta-galactosidase/beta-glucuronidase